MNHCRPCVLVACRHSLYLEVNGETGSIKLNFPTLEPWEVTESCSLDVAERGGVTLEVVGELTNLTRERVRQVEVRGLLSLREESLRRGIRAEDAAFPHPEGFAQLEQDPGNARKESNRRAQIAWLERKRAKAGGE